MVRISLVVLTLMLLAQSQAFSQSQDPPKLEVAAEFTTLNREAAGGGRTEAGVGGRVTYNINRHFSVEGAGYIFPRRCLICRNGGRMEQAVAGVKVGKRFEKWGVFAKARPGVVSFSQGEFNVVPTGESGPFPFRFEVNRLTSFAADLGGVIEFYPSRRIVTRFDAGDTLIHFGRTTNNVFIFIPETNRFEVLPLNVPSRTTHNFQFTASVGFRF